MRPNYNKMADKYYLSKEELYEISQEYGAVDWPKFLLGNINVWWRKLTNKSSTKIKHPGLFVSLLLNKPSKVLNNVVDASNMIQNFATSIATIVNSYKDKTSSVWKSDKKILKGDVNIYTEIFVNYKKVQTDNIDMYKKLFSTFKQAINDLKKSTCYKLDNYVCMSSEEISDMKLFKPDKAQKEMLSAIRYYEDVSPEFAEFAEEVAEFITNDIIKYIQDNVKVI